MLLEITQRLLLRENIGFEKIQSALDTILQGQCEPVAIAGFLTALAAKGETAEEVSGMAKAMRAHAVPVHTQHLNPIDVVGTGGDGQSTFNISTTVAFVVAGAGVPVAKHGNRAITSKCGAADLLDKLGVNINASPETIANCVEQAGIGFMFAPNHHPTMKFVQPIRKTLGFPTVFNILGPLANPANVTAQFTGVAKPHLVPIMAQALKLLNVKSAMVVHGCGMDEISISGPTQIAHLQNGQITTETLDASQFGIPSAKPNDLKGGSLDDNAAITKGILENKLQGPPRDVVLINAAAALLMAKKATDIPHGLQLAEESIQSQNAQNALKKLIEISNT